MFCQQNTETCQHYQQMILNNIFIIYNFPTIPKSIINIIGVLYNLEGVQRHVD